MGHRHNRKRTRSRPRHRNASRSGIPSNPHTANDNIAGTYNHSRSSSTHSTYAVSPSFPLTITDYAPPSHPQTHSTSSSYLHNSAAHWDRQYANWQHRTRQSQEDDRLRMFGGTIGDEDDLCENMLGVVLGLWGELDYEDP